MNIGLTYRKLSDSFQGMFPRVIQFWTVVAEGVVSRLNSVRQSVAVAMGWGLAFRILSADLVVPAEVDVSKPTPTPEMVQGIQIPVARSRKEVDSVLAAVSPLAAEERTRPFHLVLCAAPKDPGHGDPGMHDYPMWRERWVKILQGVPATAVEPADRWPSAAQWRSADVIAFFHNNPAWEPEKAKDMDAFLERGGGLVFLHWSMNGGSHVEPLAARIGRAWGPGAKWRRGEVTLSYRQHPLTLGFPPISTGREEPYWNLTGDGSKTSTLAVTDGDGAPQPQAWVLERNGGRIFVCIPGHFTWTHDDPMYRVLVYRGLCWTSHRPLNRLDTAIYTGARFSDP